MPLSYRIEKAIYALWHGFVVYFALFMSEYTTYIIDFFGKENEVIVGAFYYAYFMWQAFLLFLHSYNALSGQVLPPFNVGSWKQFWINQWYLFLNPSDKFAGPTKYRNINQVIAFREARMGAMPQSDGAKLMVETSVLDQVANGGYGENHRQAADFLNAKLGAMSQRDGLEFVKGRSL